MQKPYQFPQDGLQPRDVPAVTDGKAKVEIVTGASVGSAQVSRRAFLGGAMTIAGGALASSLLAPAPFARSCVRQVLQKRSGERRWKEGSSFLLL